MNEPNMNEANMNEANLNEPNQPKRISRRELIKRGAVLGLGAIAGANLLAACGDVVSTASSAASTTAASVNVTGEVVYWNWLVSQKPTFDKAISLFQQANPGITVKTVTNPLDNYPDLFALAEKAGTAPDVFQIPKTPNFADVVANGWLADLTQFPDWADFKKSFPDPAQNFAEGTNTIAGKTYSAPFYNTRDNMWLQLWVNTKVFKDAGIVDDKGDAKLPTTIDEMLTAARTIKQKSNGKVYGLGFGGQAPFVYEWMLYPAQLSGANPADPNFPGLDYKTGKYTYGSNPAYLAIVNNLLTFRDEGLILPDSATVDDEAIRLLFAQNKFGMYYAGTWIVNSWKKDFASFADYALINLPYVNTTTPLSYWYVSPGGALYGINPKSKNLAAAWQWFKWIHSEPFGEQWNKDGNDQGSAHPEANKPDYAPNPAARTEVTLGPQMTRIGPQPGLRNPDALKVKLVDTKPNVAGVIQAIYTGQSKDAAQALKDLDAAKQQALEQAIKDAQSAGAKVSIDDFIFADWDPTKDYLTKLR